MEQTGAPQHEGETESGPGAGGWRVTYGRRVGQRTIEGGVVLEDEPSTAKADEAFQAKVRSWLPTSDRHYNRMGHVTTSHSRTGKYVEMRWYPKHESGTQT